jgi:putative transposase
MEFYRRRLPHWQPSGKRLFLTWHLRGSLPHNRFAPPAKLTGGEAFVWMDRFLDEARCGPTWMKRDDVAQIVADAIRYAAATLSHYELHAYVVMANHVHLLILPLLAPSKLLQSVKGFSAREANKLLGRSGEAFWQS